MGDKSVFCTICSERYEAADIIKAGNCGHVFHGECLDRWREESSSCPICRRTVDQYFQLYLDFEDPTSNDHMQNPLAISLSNLTLESGNSFSNTSSISDENKSDSASSDGANREYENLLYETGLFREEIDYLNQRISSLMLENSNLEAMLLRLQSEESEAEAE